MLSCMIVEAHKISKSHGKILESDSEGTYSKGGSLFLSLDCLRCRKSRSYQQSSWSVFDQAKTLSFSAVINLFSAVL
jgi:hypothetical protein